MLKKCFYLVIFIFLLGLSGLSQLINYEKTNTVYDNLLILADEDNVFSVKDINELKDIKDFNFRRRRYANLMTYLEFGAGGGGNGTEIYSFYNFEFVLESKSDHMFTGRIAGGIVLIDNEVVLTMPATVNFIIGSLNHFEIGFGVHFSEKYQLYPVGNIGFRHQPARGGFMYKFGLTPHFPREEITKGVEEPVIKIWAGCGIGFCW